MEVFNHVIEDTYALLASRQHTEWSFNPDKAWGENASNEMVMLRDTAYELGADGKKAVNYTCITTSEKLAGEDKILLFGSDLGSFKGDTPYARIAFVRTDGVSDDDEAYRQIKDIDYVKYKVYPKGFMIRASVVNNREQVRVSKQAVADGIGFEKIGCSFIRKYKENPHVKSVTLIFVTDEGADYSALEKCAGKSDTITNALNHIMDGLDLDCHSCKMKEICDEVDGMREMHMKSAKR
ncbi:MAG: hypothetical protein RSA97_01315 [Oscillospiraceae bacterium]